MLKQQGFSLIEVLVSLIVLSFGLLGLAALQTTSLRFNHDAHLYSVAVTQANAMADRLRANKAGVDAGNYNNLSGIPGSTSTCSPCSVADMANNDLQVWNTQNAQLLPAGQGTVRASGQQFQITVMWDNDKTGATGTACSGNTQVDLTCVRIMVDI